MTLAEKNIERKLQAMALYKGILRDVLNARPSGTRQRLAMALGKNRSFITQIANSASAVPVPAQHLQQIFELCHFSSTERDRFMAAYQTAHPRRLIQAMPHPHMRDTVLHLPDLGDKRKNRMLDAMLTEIARSISQVSREG